MDRKLVGRHMDVGDIIAFHVIPNACPPPKEQVELMWSVG